MTFTLARLGSAHMDSCLVQTLCGGGLATVAFMQRSFCMHITQSH